MNKKRKNVGVAIATECRRPNAPARMLHLPNAARMISNRLSANDAVECLGRSDITYSESHENAVIAPWSGSPKPNE